MTEVIKAQTNPLPRLPSGCIGTQLILSLPRVPLHHWTTISTYGLGVSVERAPHCGLSLKAMREFPKGAFITQYEGSVLNRDEAMIYPYYKRTHFLSIGSRAGESLSTPCG